MGATPEQVFVNLEKIGNTSAASIPIVLAQAADTGRMEPGDLILLVAFDSGLTWGATVMEWRGTTRRISPLQLSGTCHHRRPALYPTCPAWPPVGNRLGAGW